MDLDDKVCLCFRVSRRKLLNYARIERIRVASQLSMCGGAGTGCGWCIPFLKQIFRGHQDGSATELDTLSAAEYQAGRAQHIRDGKGKPPAGAEPVGGGPSGPEPSATPGDTAPPAGENV